MWKLVPASLSLIVCLPGGTRPGSHSVNKKVAGWHWMMPMANQFTQLTLAIHWFTCRARKHDQLHFDLSQKAEKLCAFVCFRALCRCTPHARRRHNVTTRKTGVGINSLMRAAFHDLTKSTIMSYSLRVRSSSLW